MRWILLAAALPIVACAACDGGGGQGDSRFGSGGRFLAQRIGSRRATVVRAPARATYCPSDSLLVIVAIGSKWTGGLALRTVLPLGAVRDFQVQPSLGGEGTATAVFRPIQAGGAQLADSGTVRLEPSTAVSGRFQVTVPDSGGSRAAIRGRLSRIPLTLLPKDSCWTPSHP